MAFAACEKGETSAPLKAFGEKTELATNDKVWFGSDTINGLKTVVTQIADSRCPENVTCVWAGEAIVKLKFNNYTDSTSVNIKKKGAIDTVNFSLSSKAYQAILYSVNPYPNTEKPNVPKKALLTIIKK
jgi:hypothetical protein